MALKLHIWSLLEIQLLFLCILHTGGNLDVNPYSSCCEEKQKKNEEKLEEVAKNMQEQINRLKIYVIDMDIIYTKQISDLQGNNSRQNKIIIELEKKINSRQWNDTIKSNPSNETYKENQIKELKLEIDEFMTSLIKIEKELNQSKKEIEHFDIHLKIIHEIPFQLFILRKQLYETKEQQRNCMQAVLGNDTEISPYLLNFKKEIKHMKQQLQDEIYELKEKYNITIQNNFQKNQTNKFVKEITDKVDMSLRTNEIQANSLKYLEKRILKVEEDHERELNKTENLPGRICQSNRGLIRIKRMCEHIHDRLSCDSDNICIVDAFYGRLTNAYCPHTSIRTTSCKLSLQTRIKDHCDGHKYCDLSATNNWAGSDPCVGTVKYLEITYKCY